MAFHAPNKYRVRVGRLGTTDEHGNNGAFEVPIRKGTSATIYYAHVIASDGAGWEHVSVSFADHTPSWDEMCAVSSLFWDPEDVIMQLRPAERDYVNNHEHCLHWWRPTQKRIPTPPSMLVGIAKGASLEQVRELLAEKLGGKKKKKLLGKKKGERR